MRTATSGSGSSAAHRIIISLLLGGCMLRVAAAEEVSGEELMERSGCISCHRIDQKLIGPAFRDVAARYRNRADAADYLAGRIRGGSEEGIWGDLPMPPNPVDKISDENLSLVIEWLLSLQ